MSGARAWAPAVVALLCAGGLLRAWVDPQRVDPELRQHRAPELSEPARALLGGLKVGDRLVGWTVQALDGPTDGMLRVDLGRGEVRFALMVTPLGAQPESPPMQSERYAIYYGHAHPPGTTLPENTIHATTSALAGRLRAHEGEVEVPGL